MEILRMLFEVHHRQLEERRQRIHGITQRTVAVFLIIAGWLVASQKPHVGGLLQWLTVAGVSVLAGTACYVVYNHNRTYIEIARVVRRLNDALGLFEKNKYIEGRSIYEESWKTFGTQRKLTIVWYHLLIVVIMAAICVCAVFMR